MPRRRRDGSESLCVFMPVPWDLNGPGSQEKSWGTPPAKYEERQGPGLHTAIMAYLMITISVRTFVGRLGDPPTKAQDVEARALRN